MATSTAILKARARLGVAVRTNDLEAADAARRDLTIARTHDSVTAAVHAVPALTDAQRQELAAWITAQLESAPPPSERTARNLSGALLGGAGK